MGLACKVPSLVMQGIEVGSLMTSELCMWELRSRLPPWTLYRLCKGEEKYIYKMFSGFVFTGRRKGSETGYNHSLIPYSNPGTSADGDPCWCRLR